MHRLASILLLIAFVFPVLAPSLAAGALGEAGLPACCRREGKHHCMMGMAERAQRADGDRSPQWKAPPMQCPYCPAVLLGVHHNDVSSVTTAEAIFAGLLSHPAGTAQTESRFRVARDRSRQKRGPPAVLLS